MLIPDEIFKLFYCLNIDGVISLYLFYIYIGLLHLHVINFSPTQSNVHRIVNYIHPLTAKLLNLNFHPLEVVDRLTLSVRKLFRFDKMEVNCFQILLIDVTFYIYRVWKVVLNVLIKMKIRRYPAPAVKGF